MEDVHRALSLGGVCQGYTLTPTLFYCSLYAIVRPVYILGDQMLGEEVRKILTSLPAQSRGVRTVITLSICAEQRGENNYHTSTSKHETAVSELEYAIKSSLDELGFMLQIHTLVTQANLTISGKKKR